MTAFNLCSTDVGVWDYQESSNWGFGWVSRNSYNSLQQLCQFSSSSSGHDQVKKKILYVRSYASCGHLQWNPSIPDPWTEDTSHLSHTTHKCIKQYHFNLWNEDTSLMKLLYNIVAVKCMYVSFMYVYMFTYIVRRNLENLRNFAGVLWLQSDYRGELAGCDVELQE